jgi:hypothetical protein
MTKRIMRFPVPPPVLKQGNHFLRSEKAVVLAEVLNNQFQPVTDYWLPVDFQTVDLALRTKFMGPINEHKLINPEYL